MQSACTKCTPTRFHVPQSLCPVFSERATCVPLCPRPAVGRAPIKKFKSCQIVRLALDCVLRLALDAPQTSRPGTWLSGTATYAQGYITHVRVYKAFRCLGASNVQAAAAAAFASRAMEMCGCAVECSRCLMLERVLCDCVKASSVSCPCCAVQNTLGLQRTHQGALDTQPNKPIDPCK